MEGGGLLQAALGHRSWCISFHAYAIFCILLSSQHLLDCTSFSGCAFCLRFLTYFCIYERTADQVCTHGLFDVKYSKWQLVNCDMNVSSHWLTIHFGILLLYRRSLTLDSLLPHPSTKLCWVGEQRKESLRECKKHRTHVIFHQWVLHRLGNLWSSWTLGCAWYNRL